MITIKHRQLFDKISNLENKSDEESLKDESKLDVDLIVDEISQRIPISTNVSDGMSSNHPSTIGATSTIGSLEVHTRFHWNISGYRVTYEDSVYADQVELEELCDSKNSNHSNMYELSTSEHAGFNHQYNRNQSVD